MPIDGTPREVIQKADATPKDIMLAGEHLAASADEADHVALRAGLTDAAILNRLDPPESYKLRRDDLRLASIMSHLAKNPSPAAQKTVTTLCSNAAYLAHAHRIDLLARATSICRPPASEVVTFWEQRSEPTSIHTELVIRALARNASAPALKLLERRILDRRFDLPRRIEWCHSYLLENRAQPEVIALAERIVRSTAEPELRLAAAESIFDYRPEDWYPPHGVIDPQPWTACTKEAREGARQLAASAREALPRNPTLEIAITKTLAQLNAMDKTDAADKKDATDKK